MKMKITLEKPYPMIAPLPAVVVSVASAKSGDNLITLAWTGVAGSEPPHVAIAIRPTGRFSYKILREHGEFGVNIAQKRNIKAVDICGTLHGDKTDKWKASGLTRMKASVISVPLVEEFPINLECIVRHRLELGSHDLFVGEVVATHIDESILTNGSIDVSRLDPLAYIPNGVGYFGLNTFEKLGDYGFTSKGK